MSCDQPQYAIAVGHDNPEGLIVLEGYTPPDVTTFLPFIGYGTYDPGAFIVRGDLSLATDGNPSSQWVHSYLDFGQEWWLRSTFANGNYSGNVTVSITQNESGVLSYWNAILYLPKLSDLRSLRPGWNDYVMRFILIEELDYGELLLQTGFNLLLQTGGRFALIG